MIVERNMRKDFLRSQSVVKKRRKQRIIRWSVRIALLITLLVSVALLSQIDFFAIKRVVISGNSNISSDQIQTLVDEKIHTSYLGLFPKTNVFLYPKSAIAEKVFETFPRVKSVSVYTESLNILNVRIEERTPVALWCSAIQCYLVDDSAYIYAETNKVTDNTAEKNKALVSIIGLDEVVGSNPIGKTVLDEENFNKILHIVDEMKKNNLNIDTVEFRSKDEVNFWITSNDANTPKRKIIFSPRRDYEESYNNLLAALKSNALSTTTDFEYIDTRFGNKVFYKLVPAKVLTSTSTKSKKK